MDSRQVEDNLRQMQLELLVARCSVETERFYHGRESDSRYCYELFRRAIIQRDNSAWSYIYKQYERQVTAWVRKHEQFAKGDEEAQYFVNRAFERFAFAMRPEKFAHMGSNLSSILLYLRMCVGSAIHDYQRQTRKHAQELALESMKISPALVGESSPEGDVGDAINAIALWKDIEKLAKSNEEYLVIYCRYMLAMSAQEILDVYPERFSKKSEIYRIRANFLKRMRRQPALRARFWPYDTDTRLEE